MMFLLTEFRDHTAPPEKQAEQIMAIYPVVKGQKPSQQNVIPPHSPSAKPAETATVQPVENHIDDNLINFDDTPAPANPEQPAKPEQPAPVKEAPKESEIQGLLSSTGKQANGPLLDFTNDLKKDLPSSTQQ
jgi:hypothetical protein